MHPATCSLASCAFCPVGGIVHRPSRGRGLEHGRSHRFPRAARAVTPGRLLRFLFGGAIPLRARALVLSHRAPASRISALAGFDPYRGRLAGLSPVRGPLGRAFAARPCGRGAPRPTGGAERRCEGAPGRGWTSALSDQLAVRPGRRIVVPDELPRKHHALDTAAVGGRGAEDVGRVRARGALPVAPDPDYAVADRGRGEVPSGGERLESGRGHHVRLARDVVQPSAGGVDRHGAVAKPRPHPVDPLPACALAAERGRRCPFGADAGGPRSSGSPIRRSASSAIARNSLGPSPK